MPTSDIALKNNGISTAVCENCRVQCYRIYRDDSTGRASLVICPVCGNGDPKLDVDDCGLTMDELEANVRLLRFMHGQDPDTEPDFYSLLVRR